MISADEALARISQATTPLPAERLPLQQALGRVTTQEVSSRVDLPPFAQSAMDGWAVRAADTEGATEQAPVALTVAGEVTAGLEAELPGVGPGQAVRIFTGGQVPPGADAVIRQEDVERDGAQALITRPIAPGRDIRARGEELGAGVKILSPGTRLDERHLAALSMTGHPDVLCRREPRIALLVTGDEIIAPSQELVPGAIYDANTPYLVGLLRRWGFHDLEILHLEDDPAAVARAMEDCLHRFDLVISTGGVSVGEHDLLIEAAEGAGCERVFWKVAQKPGKPVYFGTCGQVPYLGLPGNPGAVFVCAHIYLARTLDALDAAARPRPWLHDCRLEHPIARDARRLRWAPCTRRTADDGAVILAPIAGGRAHRMSQLYQADSLVRVDPGQGALEGVARWVKVWG